MHLLDVRTVVLGGLYARLGEPLRAAVAAELAARVGPVEVRLSTAGTGGALRAAAAGWCGTGSGWSAADPRKALRRLWAAPAPGWR